MSKLPLPAFTVVPDSNALFSPDIKAPVSQGFTAAWKELQKGLDLKLVTPAVVKDEIVARRTFTASRSLANAAKSLENVSAITGIRVKPLPSIAYVRRMAERQFDKWATLLDVEFCVVPYSTIKWKQLLRDAVNRVPPFSPHSEGNDMLDKGFKDAIVLECFATVAAKLGQRNGIFITSDGLLKQAFSTRFKGSLGCQCFDTLKDFASYVGLLKENKKAEIAKAIQQNAAAIFYTLNDPNCLYTKYSVYSQIRSKFGQILDNDRDQSTVRNIWTALQPSLQPLGSDKIYLRESVYKSFDDVNGFLWGTRVEIVKLFVDTNMSTPASLGLLYQSNDRIRVTKIDVTWKSNIDAKGQFSGAEIADYIFVESNLYLADYQKRMAYGYPVLQIEPPSVPAGQTIDFLSLVKPPRNS